MRHGRLDYERIQDLAEEVPEDEPVFLLRARDKYAAETVLHYSQEILSDELATPGAREVAHRAWDWAQEMHEYGERHGKKFPDIPHGS